MLMYTGVRVKVRTFKIFTTTILYAQQSTHDGGGEKMPTPKTNENDT